nr:putative DNA methylase [Kibdelosporangium sp. MJ126-NF4]CTQ94911.1 putative DNA methylase [Kibdelosporangium sp. MJ126-NF4]
MTARASSKGKVLPPDQALTKDLQRLVTRLEIDLRARLDAEPELRGPLEIEWQEALRRKRTAASWLDWRNERSTLASVAWVLGTVFVRFCEDNGLIDEPWLSGPGKRANYAAERQIEYIQRHPRENERDWILAAFDHLTGFPAAAALFDEMHNPLFALEISADAAAEVISFWRSTNDGEIKHDLTRDGMATRFLGDLYENLSVDAQKRYALRQTPVFIEEFLLDLTLEPSVTEYGLAETSVIDPTCGSGHFLLGAFDRLLTKWAVEKPGMSTRERIFMALKQITGVDINPFAVAIARFRLVLMAMQAEKLHRLADAPEYPIRLATGDSLLQWHLTSGGQGDMFAEEGREFALYTEDAGILASYLRPGQYTVSVGNPPYITVKDSALNERYRDIYKACHRQYALSVPFIERFFQLIRSREENGRSGFSGQITASSFMKREFGRKIVEDFLHVHTDLTYVIDTSGAYIPGHGTPTVILVGRRRPWKTPTVRALLGAQSESGQPDDPKQGAVWRSIVEMLEFPGTANRYLTVMDIRRDLLATHPWSLSGGGAVELREFIEKEGRCTLYSAVDEIGSGAVTREDSAFMIGGGALGRSGIPDSQQIPLVEGDVVRDWAISSGAIVSLWPYESRTLRAWAADGTLRFAWPYKRVLVERVAYGLSQTNRGLEWFEYSMFFKERFRAPFLISYAEISTHNHFVLSRGGVVFKQSAPVIKLEVGATEAKHFELLGVLNSSVACFWIKQMIQPKSGSGIGRGVQDEEWENRYASDVAKLKKFPLPNGSPTERAQALDRLGADLQEVTPTGVSKAGTPTRVGLDKAQERWQTIREEMIFLQEELDWEIYRLYKLLDEDWTYSGDDVPGIALGERAFEIVLARKQKYGEDTAWFERHGSKPITQIPAHWPAAYRELVERRIELIESRQDIGLLERPENKRRWSSPTWEDMEQDALNDWLLNRLEDPELWREQERATARSVAQLADLLSGDSEFREVLALYVGRPDYDLTTEVARLVEQEHVPFLAALRYSDSGMDVRREWESTWDLQRKEDAGEVLADPITVPPKYGKADFRKDFYWRHRGKLDVPKERFVSYPGAERDTDKSLVLGWAGWDHLDRAQALGVLVIERTDDDGWGADKLKPLLAGLAELDPWLNQWYETGDERGSAGTYKAFLNNRLERLALTREHLAAWRPEAPTRRGRAAKQ